MNNNTEYKLEITLRTDTYDKLMTLSKRTGIAHKKIAEMEVARSVERVERDEEEQIRRYQKQ